MGYDNGFSHAQRMYDNQEPPSSPEQCDFCINDSDVCENCRHFDKLKEE